MQIILESANHVAYSHDGVNFQVDHIVDGEPMTIACYKNVADAIDLVKSKVVRKTFKDVPSVIIEQWASEFEVWFKEYASQFNEVDCCDYQDERQAFFAEKLSEYNHKEVC